MATVVNMNRTKAVGLLQKPGFHQARLALEYLHQEHPEQFGEPESVQLMEFQWKLFSTQLQKHHGGEVWEFADNVAVFCNDQFIGGLEDFLQWAADNYSYHDSRPLSFYEDLARKAYNTCVSNQKRDFVFMDVCIEGELIGRLVFELYKHLCPKTCANFVSLCSGAGQTSQEGTRLSYLNSLFHRVVRKGWVQGGDICGGSGAKGESVYGTTFEDENFAVAHESRGVLGMANHGRNTNNSQFYVTLSPSPWMDRQYVAFGRVVEGSHVLERLEAVETYNERPKELCQVSNCGLLPPLE